MTLNEARTGYTMAMPAPGVHAQMQSNMAATLNIDWLLSVFAGLLRAQGVEVERKALIARLDEWVASAAPASLLFQPYISEAGERGPFVDADARAGFIGLSTRHGFQDMLRAVFEGMALAARDCYAATGSIPSEVRLTGGAARSRVLRRILAAAVGSDVRTSSREEAGAAGAAMMAAVCIGQYPDMATCADRWVTPTLGAIEPPDDALRATYDRVYTVYAASHAALRPVWKSLAEMREHAT